LSEPVATRAAILLPAPGSNHGKLSDVAREYMIAVRAELADAHWAGATGIETSVRMATCIDNLVRFIFDSATDRFSRRYARTRQHCAIIALGGYGRREQAPYSDVDLLVLHSGGTTPYIETVTEALLYTLWDAGLEVGHAVRSPQECVDLAKTDLTIKTALMDGRFIIGSTELAGAYETEVREVITAEDPRAFAEAKVAESRARHLRGGDSVAILEPNIKEGRGGLRDLHAARWIARAMRGVDTLEELCEIGVLTEKELKETSGSREFLLRLRNALHFLGDAKTDHLTFERQEAVGERFGFVAKGKRTPGDLLLRTFHTHAAVLDRIARDLSDRLVVEPERKPLLGRLTRRTLRPGVYVSGGRITAEDEALQSDPSNLIQVFGDCQRLGLPMSQDTRELVRKRARLVTAEVASGEACVSAFFEILRGKEHVFETLVAMHSSGVLGRFIPEFGRLFCMVQHDYYHIYTVDEHSLIGIRELEKLRAGEYVQESPFLTSIMRSCDVPELLFLGMMFHDIGKGLGGDHDEKGALMVRDISKRLRMHEDQRDALEFLVRNHLLMSEKAQREDVEDPQVVLPFVQEVGGSERLTLLYLLTFADMKAVGPKIWNGWRDHLLSELYRSSAEMFSKGTVTEADLEDRGARTRQRLLDRAAGDDERLRLAQFLDEMPSNYLVAHTDEVIVDHWRLYESIGTARFRVGVVHHPKRGFTEFTICAPDKRGLFSDVAASLMVNRLSVVDARPITSSHGWAIDVFRIDHRSEADVLSADTWTAVGESLDRLFSGELNAEEMVADRLRERGKRIGDADENTRAFVRVEIDNDLSEHFTVLDVYAVDRPALLFLISNAIYRQGLSIHMAKISTHMREVLDVFCVTDAAGAKVEDPARLEALCSAISSSAGHEQGKSEDSAPATLAI
jgi:[protein-PII] uridylyltransferase